MSITRSYFHESDSPSEFKSGLAAISEQPLLSGLLGRTDVYRRKNDVMVPKDEWAAVTSGGVIHAHPTREGTEDEWAYVIAHCLLHLGLGHVREMPHSREWNAACDIVVAGFLAATGIGAQPPEYRDVVTAASTDELKIYEELCDVGIPSNYFPDIVFRPGAVVRSAYWKRLLARGVKETVSHAVRQASGEPEPDERNRGSEPERARAWFLTHYPLLASLAASFRVIEDRVLCQRLEISVAAINPSLKEITSIPVRVSPKRSAGSSWRTRYFTSG